MTSVAGPTPLVPSWLARLAAIGWRVLVTVALGLALLVVGIKLSTTVLSILVGFIVAATLSPYAARLRSRGWSALKVAGALTGALVLGIVIGLALVFIAFAPYLAATATAISDGLAALKADIAALPVGDVFMNLIDLIGNAVAGWLTAQASAIGSTLATIATIGMLALFMTFFLLLDGDKAWAIGLRGLGDRRRERLTQAGRDAIEQSGGYLRGTIATAIIAAVAEFVFMVLLSVPVAGPLAVLVFVGGLIPYLGASITTALVVLVALGANGTATAVILLVLIVAMHLVKRAYLAPRLYGPATSLHPAIVLIALPIGAALAGVLGMMVAVPTITFFSAILGPVLEVIGDTGRAKPPREDVPMWLDRLAQWSWRGLVALGLVGLVIAAAANVPLVIGPVVVALTLAATVVPALRALEARGLTRAQSALAVVVILWASIAIVTVLSIAALTNDAVATTDTSSAVPDTGATAEGAIHGIVSAYQRGLFGTIASVIGEIVGFAFFLILTALLSFFFLKDGDRAWAAAMSHITAWRRREVEIAGTRGVTILGGYMLATGVLGAFNAITGFVIMVLLGLPLALPIAVLSFLGGFIPYIGQFVTSLLAFLVAFKYGSTQDVIIMGLYTIVMNVAQGSFIAPLVYGRAVSIHPAIVLLAIPAGGELAGVLGMFLAVPVVGVFAAVWRNILTALGDEPPAVPIVTSVAEPASEAGAPPGTAVATAGG